jgi:hypothetical protein
MNKKNGNHSEKGFIAATTMILMISMLSIVMAMLYRSTQGNLGAISLKKSNQAYQNSDSGSEIVLQNFRVLDQGTDTDVGLTGVNSANKIPENTTANSFCTTLVACYDNTGTKIADPSAVKLSDVFQLSVSNTTASTTRAILVSVPQRLITPTPSNFRATLVSPPGNKITVSWDLITDPDADKIEVRRAKLSGQAASNPAELRALLSDTSLQWKQVGSRGDIGTTIDVTDTSVPSGSYVYTLKLTNKNSLRLNSLYATPTVPVTVP